MTPEQQRIAILEVMGWTGTEPWLDGRRCFERADSNAGWDLDNLPDPPNDLNAMHEAVKMLNHDQRNRYLNILCELTREDEMDDVDGDFAWCDATAAQRARAFLETLGLWDNGSV